MILNIDIQLFKLLKVCNKNMRITTIVILNQLHYLCTPNKKVNLKL